MAKYGDVVYGGAKYGATPKLAYSAEPMSIDIIKFQEAYVYFQSPTGNFTRIRLVRNQNGFSETSEDGIIVFEQNSQDGSSISGLITLPTASDITRGFEFKDGEDNPGQIPITPGGNIYYSVFLYTDQNIWVNAGKIHDVVPSNSGATSKFLNLLPRVYTTNELSPLGTVEPTSSLYAFLDGFGFTTEQWFTQIALLRPSHDKELSNYSTIPAEFPSLGLLSEPTISTVNQRRLIREAIYLYSNKGTQKGLEEYIKSLTGYAPTVSVSQNLLLSVQDSTFYNSTGNWVATGGTIAVATDQIPNSNSNAIDATYTCKIIASGSGSMVLGADAPITNGIPITAGNHYTYSFQVKSPASAGTVTPKITFYDKDDNATYTVTGSPISATSSWTQVSQTVNADEGDIGGASYVALTIQWSAAGTYYVDQVCFQVGTSVAYDEARAISILLNPNKINYIENPSFEVDDTSWTLTNLTFLSDSTNYPVAGYPSLHSGKFTATSTTWELASNSVIPVQPGTYFNASMYAYSADIDQMTMYVDVFDSSDNLLTSFEDTHMMSNMWMRHYVGGLVGLNYPTASHAHVRFAGTSVVGNSFSVDMVLAENTFKPTDYFDGSMPATVGVVWAGTANNSQSLYYPGKLTKIPRLAKTLNNWLPHNAFWRISTPAGLEYTNLSVV